MAAALLVIVLATTLFAAGPIYSSAAALAGLRRTLADPSAPGHEDMLEWLGLSSPAAFDPARFDVRDADLRLAAQWRSTCPG